MAEEAHTDALSFVCSLDDSRDVCHYERLVVVIAYDTEVRLKSRERIVCDLRARCRDCRKQCGLAGVRETYKTHVSKKLELKDEPAFFVWFAWLRVTWSLVCCSLEVVVAKTSATTLHKDSLLVWLHELEQDLSCLCILGNCAERNIKVDVGTVLSLHQLSASCCTVLRHNMLAVFQMDQCPELRIRSEDDMTSAAAVTSVRTALRDILLSSHMRRTRTTIARTAKYLYIINEIRIRHNLLLYLQSAKIVNLFKQNVLS